MFKIGTTKIGYKNDKQMLKENVSLIPPDPPARYFYKPLGIDYDFHVIRVVEALCGLPIDERVDIIHKLDSQERAVLGAFSVRVASLSVRLKSSSILLDGIIAVILRNFEPDYRYDYIALTVLRDAANRIGTDFDALLIEASKLGTPEGSILALNFMSNLSTIEQMAYRYIDEGENSRYLPVLP